MAKSPQPSPDAALAEQDAKTLYDDAAALRESGKTKEALAILKKLVERYGKRPETPLAALVARSLVSTGVELAKAGNTEDSLAACNEPMQRYGDRWEPEIVAQVARGLLNNGITLDKVGRTREAQAFYDELVSRYGERTEAIVAEQVARARLRQGIALTNAGGVEAALTPLIEALRKGWHGTQVMAAHSLGETGTSSAQAIEELISALFAPEPNVRMASAQALTKIGPPAVASLIRLAAKPNISQESRQQAVDIIKDVGTAAHAELLRILDDDNKQHKERVEALSLINEKSIDPKIWVPVFIRLFRTKEGTYLADTARRRLAKAQLPAVEYLVVALDVQDEQTVWNAALTLQMLTAQANPDDKKLLAELERAVPKLASLHHKALDNLPSGMREGLNTPYLGAVEAIILLSPTIAETSAEAKKLLARVGQKEHFVAEELLAPPNQTKRRLKQPKPDTHSRKEPPPIQTEEDEQVHNAVDKINDIVAELSPEKRVHAKVAALMTELPIKEGYEAFEYSWDMVNQAIERAFTPRLGDAMSHHLVNRMKHDNYEDKKTSSTWLNHVLRKHKHALAFPDSGEPSNLRAVAAKYANGRYCIERRTDEECTRPQELKELLPQLRFIPAAPRKRATKEEMERRSMAERELDRRSGHAQRRSRGSGE